VFFGTWRWRHGVQTDTNAREDGKIDKNAPKTGIFTIFFSTIRQKNVGRLILGYAISLAAGAFITSLGLHIFTFTFGFSTRQIPFIMVGFVAGIVLGQPLWFYISRRTDKVNALLNALTVVIVGILMFGVVLALRNTVTPNIVLPFVALTIFACGLGAGCLYSLPVSMFADCIEMEQRKSGEDKTASSVAFLTFCTKITNAVIMFIIGVSLDLIGFRGGQVTQSLNTQNWLGWILVFGVTVACTSAMFVYSGYSYRKQDFENGENQKN